MMRDVFRKLSKYEVRSILYREGGDISERVIANMMELPPYIDPSMIMDAMRSMRKNKNYKRGGIIELYLYNRDNGTRRRLATIESEALHNIDEDEFNTLLEESTERANDRLYEIKEDIESARMKRLMEKNTAWLRLQEEEEEVSNGKC